MIFRLILAVVTSDRKDARTTCAILGEIRFQVCLIPTISANASSRICDNPSAPVWLSRCADQEQNPLERPLFGGRLLTFVARINVWWLE
jgi:hypothetical protein